MCRRSQVLVAVVLFVLLLTAGCGSSLKGTTWKGDNLLGKVVSLTFPTDTQCELSTGFTGSPKGTYAVSGDQISVTFGSIGCVFTRNGDVMTGKLFGVPLSLTKQP